MKNKILVSILVIIIIVLGLIVVLQNRKNNVVPTGDEISQLAPAQNMPINNPTQNIPTNIVVNSPVQNVATNNLQTNDWVVVDIGGEMIKYRSEWEAVPQYYASPAQEALGESYLVGYLFTLPNGNTINWGGTQSACNKNDFGVFKYGISTYACLKGMTANIGLKDVRMTLSQNDINLFGDFVLKNN